MPVLFFAGLTFDALLWYFAGDRHVRFDPHSLPFLETIPVKSRSHELEYESYVPRGLLRVGWCAKHETAVPALTLLVFKVSSRVRSW